MNKWKLLIALVVIAGVGSLVLFIQSSLEISNSSSFSLDSTDQQTILNDASQISLSTEMADAHNQSTDHEQFEAELAAKLRDRLESRIDAIFVQASLFNVLQNINKHYPNDGITHFKRVIKLAFPEQAASIIRIVELLVIYNQWLDENQNIHDNLQPLELKAVLWEKRRELFGDDAELIWPEEREELLQKKAQMKNMLHTLSQDQSMTLDEKLYQLRTSLTEIFDGTAQGMAMSEGMIAQLFFNFESVQKEFQSLSAEDRQEQINHVRRSLGFSEEQISLLQQKDETRNKRWDNGLNYMAERESVVANTNAADLPEALSTLREKYFKHEAITIQKEEDSDFWRYKRRRIYGRN